MSYGKTRNGLGAGGARNVAVPMAPPPPLALTRTDRGYWSARSGIPSDQSPKLWGSIPVELYEGHHTDPSWDVKRNTSENTSGLGFVELAPGNGSTINRLRNARFVADLSRPTQNWQQSGVTPASGKQPSAADVIADLPTSIAGGLDWRVVGLGALALYWFFFRK